MIPTGRISLIGTGEVPAAEIVLAESHVTYRRRHRRGLTDAPWYTRPMSHVEWIEWDDFPFQPEGDEIGFLVQFISNLSPDELEAAVEAQIGVDGMHRQGEWIKAALLGMLPQ